MRAAVIGAGSWGTALAWVLAGNGHSVALWAHSAEVAEAINAEHRNPRYLSAVELPEAISATASYGEALADAEAAVVVTPSSVLREALRAMAPHLGPRVPVALCSKGVEEGTGLLPAEIATEELGALERLAVLSGPNHAEEVIKGTPSATVVAAAEKSTALLFRDLFATSAFRTYVSADMTGIELCAAFKNVIAIAVGMAYGVGFGDNTAAVLITRGLAEMSRLVVACGGDTLTCMGLAGAGDMVVTCMSEHSRNRRFGEQYVARGLTLEDFHEREHMVVEGAVACRNLLTLAERHGIELPIASVVREVLWNGLGLREAAQLLEGRPLTTEFHDL